MKPTPKFVAGASGFLLVLGAIVAVFQMPLDNGSRFALLLITFGLAGLGSGIIAALIVSETPAAEIISQGRDMLGAISGVALVVWGQSLIALGFVASWRLLFSTQILLGGAPGVPTLPSISDIVQLLQALTVAPTWLGMTTLGLALSLAGAWVISHSKTS